MPNAARRRGERANLDAEAIKARLGPMCPVCNVPIDEALARGCGLSHVLPDREQLALDQSRVSNQLASCKGAIDHYEEQLREKNGLRKGSSGRRRPCAKAPRAGRRVSGG